MELFPRRGKEENSKIRPKNVWEKRPACSCSAGHLLQVAVTAAVNSSQVRHHCRADARFFKPIFFLLFNLAQISIGSFYHNRVANGSCGCLRSRGWMELMTLSRVPGWSLYQILNNEIAGCHLRVIEMYDMS